MFASDFGNGANYRKMVLLLVQMRVPRQQHLSNAVPVVFLKAFVDDLLVDDDIYGGDEKKKFFLGGGEFPSHSFTNFTQASSYSYLKISVTLGSERAFSKGRTKKLERRETHPLSVQLS